MTETDHAMKLNATTQGKAFDVGTPSAWQKHGYIPPFTCSSSTPRNGALLHGDYTLLPERLVASIFFTRVRIAKPPPIEFGGPSVVQTVCTSSCSLPKERAVFRGPAGRPWKPKPRSTDGGVYGDAWL